MRLTRVVLVIIQAGIALSIGAFGLFIISSAFTEQTQDSPYIVIGAGVLVLASLFGVAAWWTLTSSSHPRGWLLLALVALVGVGVFALSVFGRPLDALFQSALGALAIGSGVAAYRQR